MGIQIFLGSYHDIWDLSHSRKERKQTKTTLDQMLAIPEAEG